MPTPDDKIILNAADKSATLDIDTSIYRLVAIKKAAYKFGRICHIEIASGSNGHVLVSLTMKDHSHKLESVAGDFRNELLDQELREVVLSETKELRNLLLTQAYSSANLIDEDGDMGIPSDDPLGIFTESASPAEGN